MDILRLLRELPQRPAAVDSAVTGAEGKFELKKLPPGRYDFIVEKTAFQMKVENGLVITPEVQTHPLKFVMTRGFTLDGMVTRVNAGPAPGLQVVAFREPNNPADFQALDKTFAVTDEKGAFRLDGLGGGRYVVAVSPEGEASVADTDVTVPAKKPLEIVLNGDSWLEGTVTGDGDKPVGDAQVYACNFEGRVPTVGTTRTDAAGHYVVRGLKSGPLQLFLVRAEGYGDFPEDLAKLFMGGGGNSETKLVPGRNEKNVTLGKGAIVRGKVLEKGTDTPIAGARVEIGTMAAFLGGRRGATTATDGTFEITSVPKGTAVLLVSKEGWFQPGVNAQSVMMLAMSGGNGGAAKDSGKGATIVVSEAGEVLERSLELAHGSSLSGTVTGPDGATVSRAQVSLVSETDGNDMMAAIGGMLPSPEPRLTDADGHFEIPGPPPAQKARVVARAQGYLDGKSDVLTCNAGDTKADIAVKLRQGATLTGRVHDPEGHALEGALVRWVALKDDANKWALRWQLRSATPTVTDAKASSGSRTWRRASSPSR